MLQFEGTIRDRFTSIRMVDITGKDRICAECNTPFTAGDKIVIFSASVYQEDDSIDISDVFLVHQTHTIGDSTCFEKFAARMISNTPEPSK